MKWLGRILVSLLAVAVLLAIALTAFVLTFDPNDYKDHIARTIEEHTGRTIHFDGDISLTLFPWLGVSLDDARLANPEGFSEPDMLQIGHVNVRAAVLPLIKGEFEIGTLILRDLSLNLERRADGRNNWDDLLKISKDDPAPQTSDDDESTPLTRDALALVIGGLDIQNSQIRYRDAINGQDITLNNLNLFAEELHLDRPVDFRLTTGVQLTEPALHSDIQLSGSLLFDITNGILSIHRPNLILSGKSDAPTLPKTFESKLDGESFQLAIESGELAARKLVLTAKATELANLTYVDLDLSTEVEGNFQAGQYALCDLQVRNRLRGLPTRTGELETKAEGNIRLDLTAGTASLLNWRIHSEPVTLTTSLNISHLFDGPHIQGPMAIAEFNPRTLAEVMQYTVPEMQDVNALTRFALNGQLDITPERAMLREVVIQLDDHRLEGEVGLADITSQHLQVSLSTDVLDANPYLPPEAEKTKPATATAAPRGFGGSQVERADDPIDLPVEMLRTLNADARLQINHLKFKEHDLRNLVLVFKARNGDLSLEQFDINAFEGQIKSKGRLDVRGDTPAWRFELDSRSIALQPLLMAVMNEDRLLGKGNLNLNINTVGNRPSALKSSLNGNLGFELRDGAIKGFNIAYALRKAQAQLKGQQEPPPEQLQTDFTAITGTATIRNGVLDNQDLQGASPLLRVEGAGTVDIARERLDYRAHVMVVDTTTGQEGRALEELRQIPIPVRITGSFQQPQIGIDLENILKDRVQQEIKRRVTEALEKRLLGNQPEDNGNEANEAMSDPIEQLRRLLPF